MNHDLISRMHRQFDEFKQQLLLSLLPEQMDYRDAIQFLKQNHVRFFEFHDGKQELHGFGRKLGDVFCGIEKDEHDSLNFVTRFTPSPTVSKDAP
jgi:hypothetical protein